jgi:hypothetical protein
VDAGDRLVEQHTEGEEIAAGIDRLSTQLLRRHVQRRPHPDAGSRDRRVLGERDRAGLGVDDGDRAGQPEVHDLDMPVRRDHHVAGLDVAVDETGPVDRRQGLGDLRAPAEQRVDVGGSLGEDLAQRPALDVLHHQQQTAVVLDDVEHRGDVGVRHLAGHAGLADEAFPRDLVRRQVRRQGLDRHQPVQMRVPGAVDLAHAAPPDLVEHLVLADGGSGQWRLGSSGLGRDECLRWARSFRARRGFMYGTPPPIPDPGLELPLPYTTFCREKSPYFEGFVDGPAVGDQPRRNQRRSRE